MPLPGESEYVREPGYAVRYRDTRFQVGSGRRTDLRERAAITRLLAGLEIPPGPWLDMPSGAGRLSRLLPRPVVQVDRDAAMVAAADGERRVCARAAQLPFPDRTFAGTLSMRLFQHIPTSEERVAILREIRRVTHGVLVASFFHAVSLQSARRVIRRRMRGRRNTGRNAVTWKRFRSDLEDAGWNAIAKAPLSRFLSEQWIVAAR